MTDRIRFLSSKGLFDQSNEDGYKVQKASITLIICIFGYIVESLQGAFKNIVALIPPQPN